VAKLLVSAIGRLCARALTGLGTLAVVAVIVFLTMHGLAGSFAQIYLGPTATPSSVHALEVHYGLTASVWTQLGRWLIGIVHLHFGVSLVSGQAVGTILGKRLGVTIELALLATAVAVAGGVPIGCAVGMAETTTRRREDVLRGFSAMSVSVPDFVIGSGIVYLISRFPALGFRVGSYTPVSEDPLRNLRDVILPVITLAVFPAALIVRTLRDSVRTVKSEQYVVAAMVRGETTAQIVRRHILRNALLPTITVIATSFGYLLGGAVIVETVFDLPGMGQELISAISNRDYNVVQAEVVIGAGAFIAVNMLSEWLYSVVDPRLRRRA